MARKDYHGPTDCLETSPTRQSIRLAGRFISLTKLESRGGFDTGYTSRIFNGTRAPSLAYATRLANALGMTRDDLLAAIEERVKNLAREFQDSLAS